MSRTSRVLASVSLGYVHMGLSMALGLWLTPFLLGHLGQRDFGVWAAAMPVLVALGLLDFGVIVILQRDVAFALGASGGDFSKAKELPATIGKTLRLVLFQMPLLIASCVVAWWLMPRAWQGLHVPAGIILGAVVVSFPLRVYHAVLMGLQDLSFLGKLNIANWAIGAVVSIVLVLSGYGLSALAVSWAVAQVLTSGAAWLRVRSRFRSVLPTRLPQLTRVEALHQLGKGFWVILAQLAVMLLAGTDLLVIAAILGPVVVAPYTITSKLVGILGNVPQYIMAGAQPALSELRTGAERGRLSNICLALTQAVLLVSGLLACILITVNRGFVGWWIGPAQFAGGTITAVLALTMLVRHWSTSLTFTLFAFGHERRISFTMIGTGVLTLIASIVLTRMFGTLGTAMAGLVGLLVVALPANLIAVASETQASVRTHLAGLWPWAWRCAFLGVGAAAAGRGFDPKRLVTLAVTTGGVAIVYSAVMFPLVLREPLGTYARPRLETLRRRLSHRG